MRLNSLQPAPGATRNRRRVGRGIGTGVGKTCGRGHKGQKSRSGGYHKVGFEGGQMPLQRRLPKRGFRSLRPKTVEVRLNELALVSSPTVDLDALKAARIIPKWASAAKVISSGEISRAVNVSGLRASAGAVKAIEAAGGSVAAFDTGKKRGKLEKSGERAAKGTKDKDQGS